MNNGTSSLFRNFNANLYAAIIFLVGAIFGFISGFAGWIGTILLVISIVLFALEKNSFVRRAYVIVFFSMVILFLSWLLFVVILNYPFFHVINWIIDIVVLLFLVFCALCAFNGKEAPIPFLGKFLDKIC
jgi:hypothetical protein